MYSAANLAVPPEDVGYQRGAIPTDVAKEKIGGLREKARANAIPHVQAEANAAMDRPEAKVQVSKACVAMARQ